MLVALGSLEAREAAKKTTLYKYSIPLCQQRIILTKMLKVPKLRT